MKHLYESIFDDDILDQDNTDIIAIRKWIRENTFSETDIDKCHIVKKNSKYIVNADTHILFKHSLKSLTNGKFEWGTINGCFDCTDIDGLKNLKGGPKIVTEEFDCSNCKNLESLEDAPEIVGEDFYCSHCYSLKNLKGAPKEVGGTFDCSNCKNLESLEGAPKEIGRYIICDDCPLDDFSGLDNSKFKEISGLLYNGQSYEEWCYEMDNK